MPPDPDLLAAELAAIQQRHEELRSRYGHVGGLLVLARAQNDVPRLLAAVERITALADQWHGERGNDYSATATLAAKLREVLSEELLGEGESHG